MKLKLIMTMVGFVACNAHGMNEQEAGAVLVSVAVACDGAQQEKETDHALVAELCTMDAPEQKVTISSISGRCVLLHEAMREKRMAPNPVFSTSYAALAGDVTRLNTYRADSIKHIRSLYAHAQSIRRAIDRDDAFYNDQEKEAARKEFLVLEWALQNFENHYARIGTVWVDHLMRVLRNNVDDYAPVAPGYASLWKFEKKAEK